MSKTTASFVVLAFISCATACARPVLLADGRAQFALLSERGEVEDTPRHLLRPQLAPVRGVDRGEFRRELETNVAALER